MINNIIYKDLFLLHLAVCLSFYMLPDGGSGETDGVSTRDGWLTSAGSVSWPLTLYLPLQMASNSRSLVP